MIFVIIFLFDLLFIFDKNLLFIVLFVDLQYLLASFVAIHDWHVQVHDYCIEVFGLISRVQ